MTGPLIGMHVRITRRRVYKDRSGVAGKSFTGAANMRDCLCAFQQLTRQCVEAMAAALDVPAPPLVATARNCLVRLLAQLVAAGPLPHR
jgi:hypothetical protein